MQQGFRPGRSPCLRVALALLALAGIGAGVAFAEPRLLEERSSTYNNIYVYKDGFPDWETRGGQIHKGAQP